MIKSRRVAQVVPQSTADTLDVKQEHQQHQLLPNHPVPLQGSGVAMETGQPNPEQQLQTDTNGECDLCVGVA